MHTEPEAYFFEATDYVPNSNLPVLVYRNVLPAEPSASDVRDYIEKNDWMQGGVFKTYPTHHYHSVTHECYAVFRGSSRTLLGRGPLDNIQGAKEVDLTVGDVIVLPAGVSHCNVSSKDNYEYVGLYPRGSPKYDNNFCKAGPEETAMKAETARRIPIPETDPVFGRNGPLPRIWRQAAANATTH